MGSVCRLNIGREIEAVRAFDSVNPGYVDGGACLDRLHELVWVGHGEPDIPFFGEHNTHSSYEVTCGAISRLSMLVFGQEVDRIRELGESGGDQYDLLCASVWRNFERPEVGDSLFGEHNLYTSFKHLFEAIHTVQGRACPSRSPSISATERRVNAIIDTYKFRLNGVADYKISYKGEGEVTINDALRRADTFLFQVSWGDDLSNAVKTLCNRLGFETDPRYDDELDRLQARSECVEILTPGSRTTSTRELEWAFYQSVSITLMVPTDGSPSIALIHGRSWAVALGHNMGNGCVGVGSAVYTILETAASNLEPVYDVVTSEPFRPILVGGLAFATMEPGSAAVTTVAIAVLQHLLTREEQTTSS